MRKAYEAGATHNLRDKKPTLFSNRNLFHLFLPLIVEQFLEYLVGLADSIMVAHVGEAAVSGVSLVDFIMQLLISLFAALATGGAVIAGQYLGRKETKDAREAADQMVWFAGAVSVIIMIGVYISRTMILHGLFGKISADVYDHAHTYLLIVAASIPALALYNAGAAVFRTMGNAKLPMKIMLVMNILHVIGNAVFIYRFHMGTVGVGISSLVSRTGAAVIVIALALQEKYPLHLHRTLRHKFDWGMLKRILSIGIPYGLENGLFFLGRLVVISLVATFGTAAIAANSVATTIVMFQVLPGMAIGLGMTVIISRCIGAGEYGQANYYTKKIMGIIYLAHLISCTVVLALLPIILNVYGLSAQATAWTHQLVWAHAIMMLIWPLGYTLPVTFRASGDATFPMIVSILTMVFCRIALSYVFSIGLHMGMFGTWVAMFADWIVKSVIFVWRYLSGRWTKFRAIG